MKNFVLIWQIKIYPEMGGGTYFETFDSAKDMDDKVESLLKEYKHEFEIRLAAELRNTIEYYPEEVITKMSRRQ